MTQTQEELLLTIENLQTRLDEFQTRAEAAEEALNAIQSGEVDALVVYGADGDHVYTLEGADRTYRVMVESIQEGVATLQDNGTILYANQRLAHMLGIPLEKLLGSSMLPFVTGREGPAFNGLLRKGKEGAGKGELTLRRQDGSLLPVLLSMNGVENNGEQVITLVATDLSEQKRYEEMVASERLARSILEQASEAIVVLDPQGVIIRANLAAEEIARENPLYQPFEKVFPLAFNNKGKKGQAFSIRQVLEGLDYKGIEAHLAREDWAAAAPAQEMHLLLSATPLHNENEEILGCIVSLTDISERSRTEKALRESEQRFRVLFEQAAAGVAMVETLSGKFIQVNQRYCEITGYSPEELSKTSFHNITPLEDLQVNLEYIRRLVAWEISEFSMEKRYYKKDGSIVWVNLSVSPMWTSGEQPGYHIAVIQDITRRKEAEEALKASEEKHRLLFETSQQGVIYQNADGSISSANPAALRILGLTMDMLQGRTAPDQRWRYIREDGSGMPREEEPGLRSLKTGKAVTDAVLGVFHPSSGEYRWINGSAVPQFRPGEAHPYQTIMTFEDITERRKGEESLQRYQLLANNTRDIILFVRHDDGRIVEANQAALDSYGFTREEMLSREISGLRAPETLFAMSPQMEQAYQGGVLFESVHVRKDGQRFPVEVNSQGVQLGGERVLLSIIRDISERKKAEDALRESEERFSKFFYASPSGINIFRMADGVSVDVNQAYLDIVGYAREELVGHSAAELSLFADLPARAAVMAALREKGYLRDQEIRIRKKSGEVRTVLCSFEVIEVRSEKMILIQAVDITARKQTEEALRESEERFSKFFYASPSGINIVRVADGISADVNQAFLEMVGYTREEWVGHAADELNVFVDKQGPMPIDSVLSGQGPMQGIETRLRKKTGEVVTTLSSLELVEINGEKMVLVQTTNISERKRLEEERRESEERFSRFFYSSPSGINIFRLADGLAVEVNDNFLEMLGYTREEVIGHTAEEYDLYVDPGEVALWMAALLERGFVRGQEIKVRKKSGEVITALCSVEVIEIRGEKMGLVQTIDITERKQAEQKVEAARVEAVMERNRLLAVMDALPVGIAILDGQGGQLSANQAYETIWRGPRPPVVSISDYSAYRAWWVDSGEMVKPQEWASAQAVLHGKAVNGQLLRIRRFDGSEAYILNSAAPILDEGGRITGCAVALLDISERKEAEERLDAARLEAVTERNRLLAVMDALPVGIAILDAQGIQLQANQAYSEIWGGPRPPVLSANERPTFKARWADGGELIKPGEWASAQALQKGRAVDGQMLLIERHDGSRAYILNSGAPIYDDQGRINGCAVSVMDITERTLAEERLAFQADLLENVHDAIIATDPGLKITWWNSGAEKIYGWPRTEALGKQVSQLLGSELDPAAREEMLQQMKLSGEFSGEVIHHSRDGRRLVIDAVTKTHKDPYGRVLGMISTNRDMTARKQAEEDLAGSRRKVLEILESIQDGFWELDRDWRFTYINQRAAQNVGFQPQDLLGKNIFEVFPAIQGSEQEGFYRQVMEQRKPERREVAGRLTQAWYEIRCYPSSDGITVFWTDINERKQAEDRIASLAKFPAENPNAVMRVSSGGLVTYANERSQVLLDAWHTTRGGQLPDDWVKTVADVINEQKRHSLETICGEKFYAVDVVPFAEDGYANIYGWDITERKQAQDALQRQTDALNRQAELLSFAHVLVRDMESRITYWSKGDEELYGWTQAEALGQVSHDLLKTRFPGTAEDFQRALEKDGHWEGELVHTRRDGSQVVVVSHQVLHRGMDGAPSTILEVNNDITGRRAAELQLEESKRLLDAIMEYVPEGITIADGPDAHIRMVSRYGQEILGARHDDMTAAEVTGKWAVYYPDGITPMPDSDLPLVRAINGCETVINEEVVQVSAGGKRLTLLCNAAPLRGGDGSVVGGIVVWRDIGAIKEIEFALRASEERYRLLFDNSPYGIMLTTPDGGILSANTAACRMFGRSEEEICRLGRAGVVDVDDPRVMAAVKERERSGRFYTEMNLLHRDGHHFPAEVSSIKFLDKDGVVKTSMIVSDISRRKQAEEELRQSETRYHALFDHLSEGFALHEIIVDADGKPVDFRFLDLNPSFEKLTGLTRAGVLGKLHNTVLPDDDPQWVQIYGAVALGGGPAHFENYSPALNRHYEVIAYAPAPCQFATLFMDITERKQAEELVRESEGKYRRLVENLNDLVCEVDKNGRFTYLSPRYKETLGYEPEELLGTPVTDLGNPLERKTALDKFGEVVGEQKESRDVWLFRHKNGEWHWVESSATTYEKSPGDVRVVVISRDITEQRRVEEALANAREQSDFMANLLENATQPFGVSYTDGRIGIVNSAFCQLLGYSKEELGMLDWVHTLTPPEWWKMEAECLEELSHSNQPVRYEKEFIHKDGRRIPVELLVNAVKDRDEQVQYYYSFVNDITERRRTQEALRQSEGRFRDALENAPMPVMLHAEGGAVLLVSHAWEDLSGYSYEEIPTLAGWAARANHEHQERFYRAMESAYRKNSPSREGEFKILTKDKKVRFWDFSTAPLGNLPDGRSLVVSMATDVTARKEVEEELKKRNDNLLLLNQATRELIGHLDINQIVDRTFETLYDLEKEGAYCMWLWNDENPGYLECRRATSPSLQRAHINTLISNKGNAVAEAAIKGDKAPNRLWVKTGSSVRPLNPPRNIAANTILVVPLCVGARVLGVLEIVLNRARDFDQYDCSLIESLAASCAIALENLRLYSQSQQAAVMAERTRLAQDLHDSVSQALFVTSVIAETLPRLWEQKPEIVKDGLEKLHRLSRGALAEMRTLLLELRPTTLVESDLGDVLSQLALTVTSRSQIKTNLMIQKDFKLPADVQITLYRIAQEALNNIIKHSHAGEVAINLIHKGSGLELCIEDNGRGFDPAQVASGHMGLEIMRERAAKFGVKLDITSRLNRGTKISASWQGVAANKEEQP